MMKYLPGMLLVIFCFIIHQESIGQVVTGKCETYLYAKLEGCFGCATYLYLDDGKNTYGSPNKPFADSSTKKTHVFKSPGEAINFLGKLGWKVVVVTSDGSPIYLMKKEILCEEKIGIQNN